MLSIMVPGKAMSRAAGMVLTIGSGCGAERGTAANVEVLSMPETLSNNNDLNMEFPMGSDIRLALLVTSSAS